MPRQTRYKGALARPIEDPFNSFDDEQSRMASEEFVAVATEAKFEDLFIQYGMKPEDTLRLEGWESLAYLLAFAHAPGFEVAGARNKGGAPKTVPDDMLIDIVRDVDYVRTQAKRARQKTILGACEYIAKSADYKRWHPPAGRDLSNWASVLNGRYHRGKRLLRSLRG